MPTIGLFTTERAKNAQELRLKTIFVTLLAIFISGCDLSPRLQYGIASFFLVWFFFGFYFVIKSLLVRFLPLRCLSISLMRKTNSLTTTYSTVQWLLSNRILYAGCIMPLERWWESSLSSSEIHYVQDWTGNFLKLCPSFDFSYFHQWYLIPVTPSSL